MMSSNRKDYSSASEWLLILCQDEVWLSQLQQLRTSKSGDFSIHCDDAIRRIGNGETFEFWKIYHHQVEPVVREVWEIAELSLPKLKIQTIGMLSMEWIEQHSEAGIMTETKKASVKKKPAHPPKLRETMALRLKGCVTDGHLSVLFMELTREGWIDGYEANFKALFSGKRDDDCVLIWMGKYGNGTLVELFKQLIDAELVILPDGFTLPAILEGHFKDKEGKWLTRLDKGDKPNNKALPFIEECVKLLKADPRRLIDGSYRDDEDGQSKYDPYDHQDMKFHKSR